jgi:hypothetical protein
VNSRVSGKLVRPAESLGAASKAARMWLLTSVSSDMSSLMFQSVEGLVTERTFVGSWKICSVLVRGVLGLLLWRRFGSSNERGDETDGSHIIVVTGRGRGERTARCKIMRGRGAWELSLRGRGGLVIVGLAKGFEVDSRRCSLH